MNKVRITTKADQCLEVEQVGWTPKQIDILTSLDIRKMTTLSSLGQLKMNIKVALLTSLTHRKLILTSRGRIFLMQFLLNVILKVTEGDDHRILITPRPKPPPEEKKEKKVFSIVCTLVKMH